MIDDQKVKNMVVISVSISGDKLKEFDEVVKKLGFSSRSDAIRNALHRFVIQHRWIDDIDKTLPFITTIVYPYKRENAVHDSLHEFNDIIITATHTHFGDRCVEWVILRGDNEKLKQFIQRISAIKDVIVCRCLV